METKWIERLETLCRSAGCKTERGARMSAHTTFKIGGPAALLVHVGSQSALAEIVGACREQEIPWMVLGNGSNLLVSDEGLRGVVLRLDGEWKSISLQGEREIRCGAAASLSALCAFAREHCLTGLEFAWGIPGSAGGAAFMNAGAYGGEMKQVLKRCTHMTKDGVFGSFSGDALDLSYRHSVYSDLGAAILELHLELQPGDQKEIAEKMEDLMNRRKEKQPLEYPSAGSVFKRPEGYFAGALIEGCGLKGFQIGGAQVSEKHAGFIINRGGATCEDVCRLIAHIQETVLRETGVSLECEVRVLR